MFAPRRFLPSISSLLALEAVERLGSASAAAEELNLTQSAVSRQLKKIEEQMGVSLVLRDGVKLALTPAGVDYVRQVRKALQQIAQASLKLKANPTGGSLDLAILPTFGMHWLAPRLQDFAARHPEVTVNLSTRLRPFDFASEGFHAAIHFGHRNWVGVDYLPLKREDVVAVGAPGLLGDAPLTAEALSRLPLLHLETRPDAWERWFAAQGVDGLHPRGTLFDQFSTMAQAAAHGLGLALLPRYLAENYLTSGDLQLAHAGQGPDLGGYYLVWPKEQAEAQPLATFRGWLEGQSEWALV